MSDKDVRVSWQVNLAVFVALIVFFIIIYTMGDIATPFVIAILLAYILNPAAEYLKKFNVPRAVSGVGIAALMFTTLGVALAVSVYVLQIEISSLISNFPQYVDNFRSQYYPHIKSFVEGFTGPQADLEFDALQQRVRTELSNISPSSYASAAGYIVTAISGTVSFMVAMFTVLLIPVLLVYFIIDFTRFREGFYGLMPDDYRDDVMHKLTQVKTVLKDFALGQLTVALILGGLYSIGLWLVGIDLPMIVGFGAGIGNMIPYFGTGSGVLISEILILLKYHDIFHAVMVLVVFGVVQSIGDYLITPRVVGNKLGLHPLVIILALLVFGKLLGFVGMVIAVPVAAVIKVFFSDFIRDYKGSGFFKSGERG